MFQRAVATAVRLGRAQCAQLRLRTVAVTFQRALLGFTPRVGRAAYDYLQQVYIIEKVCVIANWHKHAQCVRVYIAGFSM